MFRLLLAKLYNRELISFEKSALKVIEEIYFTDYYIKPNFSKSDTVEFNIADLGAPKAIEDQAN